MTKIKCERCGNKTFIVDERRSGYKPPDPMPPLTVGGTTTFTYHTYMKCSKCELELPNTFNNVVETVTYTFEPNPKYNK